MSGSGAASNTHLYGGADGNPASVTAGGNLGAQLNYDKIQNIGRLVLRLGQVTRLPDIPASAVMMFNKAGNGNIWYAGYGTYAPQIGVGIPIPENTPATFYCTDANQISFTPEIDGNEIYVIAFASGTPVPLTPSNPPPLDLTSPTIVSTSPSASAAGVQLNAIITLTASEALDPNTVSSSTITVSPSITGTVSVDSANPNNILIHPTVNMATSTTYIVTVSTGLKDLAGNALAAPFTLTFSTASTAPGLDTVPPTVISSNPAQNATAVNPSITPTVIFSEAILPATISTNTILAYLTANNQPITTLSFSQSTDQKTITINGMNLTQSTAYRIDVIGGSTGTTITDLAGNKLASTYSIAFTTSAPLGSSYSVAGNDYDILQGSSGNISTGMLINTSGSKIHDKTPINYSFTLKRIGAMTGNVTFVWEAIDNNNNYYDFKTLGSVLANSINGTDTIINIDTSTNKDQLFVGDCISVRFSNGNSSNYIMVKISNYDAFDGSNTCNMKVSSNGNRNTYTSVDLAATINFSS